MCPSIPLLSPHPLPLSICISTCLSVCVFDSLNIIELTLIVHQSARIVKGRIEQTTLGEISEYIEEVYLPDDCFLLIKLDLDRLALLKLEVDVNSICSAFTMSKLKIKPNVFTSILPLSSLFTPLYRIYLCLLPFFFTQHIDCHGNSIICIKPSESSKSSMFFTLQHLKQSISAVVIKVCLL